MTRMSRDGAAVSGQLARRLPGRTLAGSLAVIAGAGLVLTTTPANAAELGYATGNKGALYNIAEVVGAHAAYTSGIAGKGVGVALIDTGVSPVQGLTSGNVVDGADLSFDSQDPQLAHLDAYGHGTHLASIIA